MTDEEAIEAALAAIDPRCRDHVVVRRNGRDFMALPASRSGAIRALKLYQPQRPKAVLAMLSIRLLAATGLHRLFLPRFRGIGGMLPVESEIRSCLPDTAGVMLGSPEHPVRRAILSYETVDGWEVAKVAFGPDGRSVIDGEHSALSDMPSGVPGIPKALGVHHSDELSMLRLPYFQGWPLTPGKTAPALALLKSWVRDLSVRRAEDFPEWPAIYSALESTTAGREALARIAGLPLRPVIRHGDFARWNLLEPRDGSCVAIDWEWGIAAGMPGIDLVHFFAQDARLVHRLPPAGVVSSTLEALRAPACRRYLESTGWNDEAMLAILAGIAFTVGTRQQANEKVLDAALALT
jgi:hypothetical protein